MSWQGLDGGQLANVSGMDRAIARARDNLDRFIEQTRAQLSIEPDRTRATAEVAQALIHATTDNTVHAEMTAAFAVALVRLADPEGES